MNRASYIGCFLLFSGCGLFGGEDCLVPRDVELSQGSAVFYSLSLLEAVQHVIPFVGNDECPAFITGLAVITEESPSGALVEVVTPQFDLQLRLVESDPSALVELVSYAEPEGSAIVEVYEQDLKRVGDDIRGEIALRVEGGSIFFRRQGIVRGKLWATREGTEGAHTPRCTVDKGLDGLASCFCCVYIVS